MLLDSRESAVAPYDVWNDAIFHHFFGQHKAERDIRLAFDDTVAASIGSILDATTGDFIETVADLLNYRLPDPFGRFRELGARDRQVPSTVGLLAAQVLVASRMQSDSQFSAQAFWPRFNKLLLRIDDRNQAKGCAALDQFWRDLERFLNIENGGRLGVLRLPEDATKAPLRGWSHVNYPLSQCLVREVDKRDLAEFLLENSEARECSKSRLVAVLERSSYAFGKSFGSTLKHAVQNPAFAQELAEVLVEIRDHVANFSAPVNGSVAGRRRARSRLKLGQSRGQYVLFLQQMLDDWEDVERLDADQWENGVSDDRGESLWNGADYTVFVEGPDGFVTSNERVQDGDRLRLLLPVALRAHFADDLTRSAADEVVLDGILESLCFYQFAVSEERDASLLQKLGLKAGASIAIRLEGGLDIGHSRFVQGSAPRIRIENAVGSRVTINRVICELNDRDYVRNDRTPKNAGEYEVAVNDVRLRYSIVNLTEAPDSADGGYVGYVLSAKDGVLTTCDFSLKAVESTPDSTILIGAEPQ
jgi:hypothetical protein